ncbi:uncharacterized protein LOC132219148 isoform X4 [Myotis daubentonii]|uniref:uncharacterized protein LOC132219148 isoform X4 n=1 Tax=Myotis daubentonii TaxID=98922 RepID=UPI002873DFCA|nr:uncharacterized protein LOC132219148 isoform X4 [Myotis daubentonii]
MRRKGRMHAQLRAPGRLLLSRGAPLGPRRSFALTNSSPAAAPLRRPRRTQFQSRGRPSSCRLDGCPRKMRSRQPRRLGEEGVRRLPPAPPDENFRSERGVGDPGEAREACTCLLPPRGRDRPLVPGSPPHEAAICILPVCTSENSLLAVPTKSRSTRGQFLHENRKPGPCSPRTPD